MTPTERLLAAIAPFPSLTPDGFFTGLEMDPEERANTLERERAQFFTPTGLLVFVRALDLVHGRPQARRLNYAVTVAELAASARLPVGILTAALLAEGFMVGREGIENAFSNLRVARAA